MPSIRIEDLSSFGRLALKLDEEFSELARLSGQIERLELESDSDLDHAVKLLSRFSQEGQSTAQDMQEFSKALQEARERSEVAARSVGERARLVQERRQRRDQLQERLVRVEQDIGATNAGLIGGRNAQGAVLSDEERDRIKAQFEQLHLKMAGFIETAQAIREEAAEMRFTRIERDAQSMLDTLHALSGKLRAVLSKG